MADIYSTDIQVWADLLERHWTAIQQAIVNRTRASSQLECIEQLENEHRFLVRLQKEGVDKIQSASSSAVIKQVSADLDALIADVRTFLRQAQADEQIRVNRENVRVSNEDIRNGNELVRIDEENGRQYNETQREASEGLRLEAERTRKTDWSNFFGATENAGVRRAWSDWFSDTLSTGVRKMWNDFWPAAKNTWENWFGTDDQHGVRKDWNDMHTQYTTDHTASVTATTEASNVNAELNGMTVTITNRQGTAKSVDLSFDFYKSYESVAAMNADAANIPKCSLVSIATTVKTDPENARIYQKRSDGTMIYIGDLDQASAEAWADWLNNKKPAIESATTAANNAAALANTKAELADTKASLADEKATFANTQANRAKAFSDNPWEIREDGYIWVYDETTAQMVKTNKMIIDFDDLTPTQRQALIDSVICASVEESIAAAEELT